VLLLKIKIILHVPLYLLSKNALKVLYRGLLKGTKGTTKNT